MIKRLFTAISLILTVITLSRADVEKFEYMGLEFSTASDGSNNVSLVGGSVENGQLIIPASVKYNGKIYTVNDISFWSFQTRTDIISIVMPDCIVSVGTAAFGGCTSLEAVRWSKGLKRIGGYSFAGCKKLKSAILPEGLSSIGTCAFSDCNSMTELSLPQTLTEIGIGAFSLCDSLISIDIPAGVSTIRENTIKGKKLTNIILHEGLNRIEKMAISDCPALKELRFPESLSAIAESAVFFCYSVETIYAPWPRPIPVGSDAFSGHPIIHVPVNTSSFYRNATNWTRYEYKEDLSLGAYYTYTVNVSGNGSVQLLQEGQQVTKDYLNNNCPLTIIVHPEEGYELKSLTINGQDVTALISDNSSYTIPSPDCNINVEAVFGLPDFVWLTIRQGIGGATCLKVAREEPVELSFKTDEGWFIHSITLNGMELIEELESGENLLYLPTLEGSAVLNVAFEQDSGLLDLVNGDKMHVTAYSGTIHIKGLEEDTTVAIYTSEGQQIAILKAKDGQAKLSGIPNGVYLVTDGVTTVKIAL